MKAADIVEGGVYVGADPKNTREVVSIGRERQNLVYRPTGKRTPGGFRPNPDGTYNMTVAAFARWAQGRVDLPKPTRWVESVGEAECPHCSSSVDSGDDVLICRHCGGFYLCEVVSTTFQTRMATDAERVARVAEIAKEAKAGRVVDAAEPEDDPYLAAIQEADHAICQMASMLAAENIDSEGFAVVWHHKDIDDETVDEITYLAGVHPAQVGQIEAGGIDFGDIPEECLVLAKVEAWREGEEEFARLEALHVFDFSSVGMEREVDKARRIVASTIAETRRSVEDGAWSILYTADDHRALRLGRAIVGMARTVAADATVMAMVNDLIGLADGRLKSEGRQWDPAAEPNLSRRAAMLLAADYAAGADRPGYVTLFAHTSTIEGDDSLDLDICEGFGVTRETMAALAANPGDLGTLPADEMYVFVLCRVLWEVDGIGVEPYLEVVATMSSAEFAGEEAPR